MRSAYEFLAIVLFLLSSVARADLRFDGISPANPTSDDSVQIAIWFSRAVGFVCDYTGPNPTFEQISITGDVIRAQFTTTRFPTADGGICPSAGPSTPFVYNFALGRVPAGNYTLELVARDVLSPSRPLIQVAVVPLSIASGSLLAVPTIYFGGLTLLVFGIVLLAVYGFTRRAL